MEVRCDGWCATPPAPVFALQAAEVAVPLMRRYEIPLPRFAAATARPPVFASTTFRRASAAVFGSAEEFSAQSAVDAHAVAMEEGGNIRPPAETLALRAGAAGAGFRKVAPGLHAAGEAAFLRECPTAVGTASAGNVPA